MMEMPISSGGQFSLMDDNVAMPSIHPSQLSIIGTATSSSSSTSSSSLLSASQNSMIGSSQLSQNSLIGSSQQQLSLSPSSIIVGQVSQSMQDMSSLYGQQANSNNNNNTMLSSHISSLMVDPCLFSGPTIIMQIIMSYRWFQRQSSLS